MTDAHLAILYARQLIAELPTTANMRDPEPGGRASAHRVNSVRALFTDLLRRAEARTFLEIGCHEAEASVRFVTEKPCRVAHAVEANPYVFERTRAALTSDRIVLHNAAVSDRRGRMTFNVPVDPTLAHFGSLKQREGNARTQPVEVDAITLDDVAQAAAVALPGPRDVGLWIDVEGAALEVLLGGQTALARVAAAYLEVQDSNVFEQGGDALAVIAHLVAQGFVPVARDNQFPGAFNLLFAHHTLYRAAHDLVANFHVRARQASLALPGPAAAPASRATPYEELTALFESAAVRALPYELRQPVNTAMEEVLTVAIDTLRPGAIVEVGAFDAAFSIVTKARHPGIVSVAFEANPHVVERFAGRARAAGVDYRHGAICAENGEIDIHIPMKIRSRELSLVNTMASVKALSAASATVPVRVPAVRLDDALALAPRTSAALWIDVEGAMEGVITGGEGTFAASVLVYCEVETTPMWPGQLLADDVVRRLAPFGLVPLVRDAQRPHQFNLLFVRKNLMPSPPIKAAVKRYLAAARRWAADATGAEAGAEPGATGALPWTPAPAPSTAPTAAAMAPLTAYTPAVMDAYHAFCNTVLRTDIAEPPPASLQAVVARIGAAIAAHEPLSLIRLGDGEGACLFRPGPDFATLRHPVVGRTLTLHFGNQSYREADFDDWGTRIGAAAAAADILAAPSLRASRALATQASADVRGTVGIATAATTAAELALRPGVLFFPSWHLHAELLPHYAALLRAQEIGLVTCYDEAFASDLCRYFRANLAGLISIAPQAVNTKERIADPLYPAGMDRLRRAVDALARPGLVLLVAAGLAAKDVCVAAAARGAVALDVGSVMDVWAGKSVRPYQTADFVATHRLPTVAER